MKTTYNIIQQCDEDPTSLDHVRHRICVLSNDIILLEEILGYLLESLDASKSPRSPRSRPAVVYSSVLKSVACAASLCRDLWI